MHPLFLPFLSRSDCDSMKQQKNGSQTGNVEKSEIGCPEKAEREKGCRSQARKETGNCESEMDIYFWSERSGSASFERIKFGKFSLGYTGSQIDTGTGIDPKDRAPTRIPGQ